MPSVVDVIVRSVVGLPFRHRAAQAGLVFLWRHQPFVVIKEGVRHRRDAESGLDLMCKVACLVGKARRADELHVPECQFRHHVIGEPDARLGDPSHRSATTGHGSNVPSVVFEHVVNLLLWMPRLGERQAYWIWLKRGGKLSEVASAPTNTNSFKVQVPVCGNIASLVYLVVVYIRQSASIAPGHLAAACEVCVVGRRLLSIHFSGSTVSKVKTTLQ